MAKALLITQCLQNDFVYPYSENEQMPNLLHIGALEAKRLVGEDIASGPIAKVLDWAHQQPAEELSLVHIRDWHQGSDPKQNKHFEQFGEHCVANTWGAEFVFPHPIRPTDTIIQTTTLNDFEDPNLSGYLDKLENQPIRIGIMGVWTEAKITFLCYELATRYPNFELIVCSALTASSSRTQHYVALGQLSKLLGVKVVDSIGAFTEALTGKKTFSSSLKVSDIDYTFNSEVNASDEDIELIKYLFRDSQKVELKVLDGGFSGNLVLGCTSIDQYGHEQAPHVLKIGPRDEIARERTAFEKVEHILGNNAPRVTDFADFQDRGAIKYRYASMDGGKVKTLQSMYMDGVEFNKIQQSLDDIFTKQLGKFYRAAQVEPIKLLEYYEFSPKWAGSVERKAKSLSHSYNDTEIEILPELKAPNVVNFYSRFLQNMKEEPQDVPVAFLHGDLNGANALIDTKENVWLLDFFHTHRGHVIKDLVKLENDLLYIFTPLEYEKDLIEACKISDWMSQIDSIKSEPILDNYSEKFHRTLKTLKLLRSYMVEYLQGNHCPQQLFIAQLRYAIHTTGFEECSDLQKKWALYTGCKLAERITCS